MMNLLESGKLNIRHSGLRAGIQGGLHASQKIPAFAGMMDLS
jgi:hypothetical protein